MAVSKNNRRKKTKRTQNHSAPAGFGKKHEAKIAAQQEEIAKKNNLSIICFFGMLLSLAGALFTNYGMILYPISFACAVENLMSIKKRRPRRSKGDMLIGMCYIIYIAVVAGTWWKLL